VRREEREQAGEIKRIDAWYQPPRAWQFVFVITRAWQGTLLTDFPAFPMFRAIAEVPVPFVFSQLNNKLNGVASRLKKRIQSWNNSTASQAVSD